MERREAVLEEREGEVLEAVTRTVEVVGLTEIAFDRYPGNNETNLEPHQKFYTLDDMKTLALPAENIMSFLSAQNTVSVPQRLGIKGWKKIALACLSYVSIEPLLIPFTRDGRPIVYNRFEGDMDKASGMRIKRHVARLPKGIPNPKVRPFLPRPWSLTFTLRLYPNREIQEVTLRKLFVDGGLALGFGTFRGVFGKFQVRRWS